MLRPNVLASTTGGTSEFQRWYSKVPLMEQAGKYGGISLECRV